MTPRILGAMCRFWIYIGERSFGAGDTHAAAEVQVIISAGTPTLCPFFTGLGEMRH
jgi:hypothetical protein